MEENKELSVERIKALVSLGEKLQKIHNRLVAEGQITKEGKFLEPITKD